MARDWKPQELVAYFERFASAQPGVTEWELGLRLARSFVVLCSVGQPAPADIAALLAEIDAHHPNCGTEVLASNLDKPLAHGFLVTFFKRAFPDIPLRTLLEAGLWRGCGSGSMTDAEFDQLLAAWLPRARPLGGTFS